MTWQPIETAPRDGTRFLGRIDYMLNSSVQAVILRYDMFLDLFLIDMIEQPPTTGFMMLTHWQPLPSTEVAP